MKRRFAPVNRPYSDFRTLSSASPRCFMTWNLSNKIAACGGMCERGISERLPHVHDGQTDAFSLLFPQKSIEFIHACLTAIGTAEPDRPMSMQIADHDTIGVSFANRDLVDADRFRSWRTCARQLRLHVLHLQFFDRIPVQLQFLGDFLDRTRAAALPYVIREALGVERIVGEKVEPLALHSIAATTANASYLEPQVHTHRAVGQIPALPLPPIVPAHAHLAALAADRFFARRRRARMRPCGSPKNPRTIASGANPGNRYASQRRRLRIDLTI